MVATRGFRVGGVAKKKGAKYMAMEDDLTLGGRHTMQYTDHVSKNAHLKPIYSY